MKEVKIDGKGRLMVKSDAWRRAEWRECYRCGEQFAFPVHYTTVKNKGKFCSTKCTALYRAKQQKAQRPWKRCAICNKSFEIEKASHFDRHHTCTDPRCRMEYKSQVMLKNWAKRR